MNRLIVRVTVRFRIRVRIRVRKRDNVRFSIGKLMKVHWKSLGCTEI